MIPKIIHYVWFGGKPYPAKIQKCIDSWMEHLPDYQFIRWDESNFDVNSHEFTREAFSQKMWAFVSDYVRIAALARYGGWYLDTDVELFKSLDPFNDRRMVFGTDDLGNLTAVYGTEAQSEYWSKVKDLYDNQSFSPGETKVINAYLEDILSTYGYVKENRYQNLGNGIEVFPDDYFHVASIMTGKMHRTKDTVAIHWQTLSWCPPSTHFKRFIRTKIIGGIIGSDNSAKLAFYFSNLKKKLIR